MFNRHKLSRDGAQTQALVLEKKVFVHEEQSGRVVACRYRLRVKFEDGTTTDVVRSTVGHTLGAAAVGDVVPMRYDPEDRSRIELDRDAMGEQQKAEAQEWTAAALARGEAELGLPSGVAPPTTVEDPSGTQTDDLRIGDADRDLIT